MSWDASPTAATQLVNVTSEQFFSFTGPGQLLSLNPGESMQVEVNVNFPASPTDLAILALYPSIDGGATYANTPAEEYTIDKALDPNRYPLIIAGYKNFRLGIRRSGTTDTITSADLKYLRNGVNL